jgi:hypothetical protein
MTGIEPGLLARGGYTLLPGPGRTEAGISEVIFIYTSKKAEL